mmetsp:Transcript_31369/g.78205  ORF Transcript_31369/g.78205 Transcript_31369/m.78205 type:complete len:118 (-) Transcript_31369:298-651(-)
MGKVAMGIAALPRIIARHLVQLVVTTDKLIARVKLFKTASTDVWCAGHHMRPFKQTMRRELVARTTVIKSHAATSALAILSREEEDVARIHHGLCTLFRCKLSGSTTGPTLRFQPCQ